MFTAYIFYPLDKPWRGNKKWPRKDVAQSMVNSGKYAIEEIDLEVASYNEAIEKLLPKLEEEYEAGYEAIYLEEREPEVQVWSLK